MPLSIRERLTKLGVDISIEIANNVIDTCDLLNVFVESIRAMSVTRSHITYSLMIFTHNC